MLAFACCCSLITGLLVFNVQLLHLPDETEHERSSRYR